MRHKLTRLLIWYWLPVGLYLAAIFVISSLPNIEIPLKIKSIDKFAHFIEYTILGYLLVRALNSTRQFSSRSLILISLSFILLWGISDEIHQGFVSGRTASISDLVFDLAGGVIGSLLYLRKR